MLENIDKNIIPDCCLEKIHNKNKQKNVTNFENDLKEQIKKIKNIEKEIQIEKIAFSLFVMYYYRYDFYREQNDIELKAVLTRMKDLWLLGKMKNKLEYFFDLANKFYETDLNNNKEELNNGGS